MYGLVKNNVVKIPAHLSVDHETRCKAGYVSVRANDQLGVLQLMHLMNKEPPTACCKKAKHPFECRINYLMHLEYRKGRIWDLQKLAMMQSARFQVFLDGTSNPQHPFQYVLYEKTMDAGLKKFGTYEELFDEPSPKINWLSDKWKEQISSVMSDMLAEADAAYALGKLNLNFDVCVEG